MKYYFIAFMAFLFASSSVPAFAQDASQTNNTNSDSKSNDAVKSESDNKPSDFLKSRIREIADAINDKDGKKADKQQDESISEDDLEVVDKNKPKLSNTLEEFESKKQKEEDKYYNGFRISAFAADDLRYGADIAYRFNVNKQALGLRLYYARISGENVFTYEEKDASLSKDFAYDQKGNEFALFLDYIPFRFGDWGDMYFTFGMNFGKQNIEARRSKIGAVRDILTFNGNDYEISGNYLFMSDIERNLTGPYLGVGFDFDVAKHVALFAELGVAFLAKTEYNHSVFVDGWVSGFPINTPDGTTALKNLILDYSRQVQNSIFGEVLPKVRFGLSIKF